MNFKILVATILLIGFTISVQAQKTIGSVEQFVEQRAKQQRAAEKADPTLSKTRPGRIPTKEEKVAMQKAKKAKHQEMAKAMKGMKSQKLKITTSKNQKKQLPKSKPTESKRKE